MGIDMMNHSHESSGWLAWALVSDEIEPLLMSLKWRMASSMGVLVGAMFKLQSMYVRALLHRWRSPSSRYGGENYRAEAQSPMH